MFMIQEINELIMTIYVHSIYELAM